MRPTASTLRSLAVATVVAFLLGLPFYASGQDRGGASSRSGSSGGGRARARAGSGSADGGHVSSAGGPGSSDGHVSSPGGGSRSRGGRVWGTRRGSSSPGVRSAPQTSQTDSKGTSRAKAISRPRDDRPAVARAVPRPADSPAPPDSGGGVIVGRSYYGSYYNGYYGGYYPWGYGGLGLSGYYGRYNPWWYDRGYYGRSYRYYSSAYEGGLRLRVKPNHAEVFVDGYYVGIVDEFDNSLQRLRLETGPHRIEVRADGHAPLTFEVRILPGRTVTYRGELRRVP